jgi:hypothetical protein
MLWKSALRGRCLLTVLLLCGPVAWAESPRWFKNARICGHWIWGAEYQDQLYSDKQLKKQVADAANAGYNLVFTGLPLNRGILGIDDPDIVHEMKVVADECHRRGMHAVFHYVTLNIKQLTDRYKGLSETDAEKGQPVEVTYPAKSGVHSRRRQATRGAPRCHRGPLQRRFQGVLRRGRAAANAERRPVRRGTDARGGARDLPRV